MAEAELDGTGWPVPPSARADENLLRIWGEVAKPLREPIRTHRRGLGRLTAIVKELARRLVLPVVEGPLIQQAAWNSEVLRRIVELEAENLALRRQLGLSHGSLPERQSDIPTSPDVNGQPK